MKSGRQKIKWGLWVLGLTTLIMATAGLATAAESRLTTDGDDQRYPSISGDKVVWQDNRFGLDEIYGLTLGGAEQRLTMHPGKDQRPRIDSVKVVFESYPEEEGDPPNPDIVLYDFTDDQTSSISNSPNTEYGPDISGDKVVWYEIGPSSWDIKLKDTSDGLIYSITTASGDQIYPRISGNYVVWQDERAGQGDIYYYDLAEDSDGDGTPNYKEGLDRPAPDPAEKPLVVLPSSQKTPDIEGSRVVWADNRNGNYDIYHYNLADPGAGETRVTSDPKDQMVPAVSGNRVVWTDWRNGNGLYNINADIYTYNLISGAEVRLTTNGSNQKNPAISGNKVVYEDDRNSGFFDIYMFDLGALDETPPTGAVSINSGAAYANSPSVTLALSGSDAVGVSQMRFSNDNLNWTAWEAYAASKSYALPSGEGAKTVYVQYSDMMGNVSVGAISDSIIVDTMAPTASRPISPPYSTNISKNPTFKVQWTGSDPSPGSGIASYFIQYKINAGGSWKTWKQWTGASEADFKGTPGRTYYFRAQAKDAAGNVSGLSSARRTIVPYDQGSLVVERQGFGETLVKAGSNFYKGTVRFSRKRGHKIVYRFKGKGITLISTKGRNRSKAKIFVDGKYIKTIDTYARTSQFRAPVFSRNLQAGAHELRIVNLGTPGRRRFDVDGLAVRR